MAFLINIWYFFAILLIIANIFSFFGKFHWFFDLWSHFRVQYFLLGTVLIVGGFLVPQLSLLRGLFWAVVVFLSLNFFVILPYFKFSKYNLYFGQSENNNFSIKILFSNIYRYNYKFDLFLKQIEQQKPDFVAIVEFSDQHKKAFEVLYKDYDYTFELTREDGFGIAFYSKYSFEEVYRSTEMNIPFLIFKVLDPTQSFHIAILHPPPPISKSWFEVFNFQLKELTEQIKLKNLPNLIIVGDLNASVFGCFYKKFVKENNLLDPRKIFGLKLSWAKSTPFFLSIDHILTTRNFKFKNFKILKNIGSDHRPIIAEIVDKL